MRIKKREPADEQAGPVDREINRIDTVIARAYATFQAAESTVDGQLRDASAAAEEQRGQPGWISALAQLFEIAEREADRQQIDADTTTQQVMDRLRTGQLSRRHLATLARAIAAQLGEVEIAIRDARAAREADARKVEGWIRIVTVATEQGRPDLADAAQDHVENLQSNASARDAALHETLEVLGQLHARLCELGRVVLEAAG